MIRTEAPKSQRSVLLHARDSDSNRSENSLASNRRISMISNPKRESFPQRRNAFGALESAPPPTHKYVLVRSEIQNKDAGRRATESCRLLQRQYNSNPRRTFTEGL